MSIRLFLAVLLGLSACSDFDQLGRDARCRATACDADAGPDAGEVDAGLDAGAPDAGTVDGGEDAGTIDAGLFQLQPLWAQADDVPNTAYAPRPGFVTASGTSRVAHLREFVQLFDGGEFFPDSGVGFPSGSVLGDLVLLDLATGAYVLEDGGLSPNPNPSALRAYVLGERATPNTRGDFLFVPSSERRFDGGTLTADGGKIVYGDVVMLYELTTLVSGPTSTGLAKGATVLALSDGGRTLSWLPPGSDAGLFSVDEQSFTQSPGFDCPAPLLDVVTTLEVKQNGTPDHRLVQLAECTPDVLSVVAWSRETGPAVNRLATLPTRGGRLAVGPESLNRRRPFVAWKGADTQLHLTRFREDGASIFSTRAFSRLASGARIAALAVDRSNSPLVVIEAQRVGFLDLPDDVNAPGTELILASFQQDLQLRWAAPLTGVNRMRVNSAAFVGDALVLDVSCPRLGVQNGDFCQNDRSTFAVRVGLADGGLPP
jgi:hypothetical protein